MKNNGKSFIKITNDPNKRFLVISEKWYNTDNPMKEEIKNEKEFNV